MAGVATHGRTHQHLRSSRRTRTRSWSEHFLLTPGELKLVLKCRGNVNRCGMALLLKTLPHLRYLPGRLDEIPPEVREFVAGQIGSLRDCSEPAPLR